jgi:hypothetical protein
MENANQIFQVNLHSATRVLLSTQLNNLKYSGSASSHLYEEVAGGVLHAGFLGEHVKGAQNLVAELGQVLRAEDQVLLVLRVTHRWVQVRRGFEGLGVS